MRPVTGEKQSLGGGELESGCLGSRAQPLVPCGEEGVAGADGERAGQTTRRGSPFGVRSLPTVSDHGGAPAAVRALADDSGLTQRRSISLP